MSEFLQNLQWWHWMVLAVVLAAAETFVPGAVVIWFAASAAVIGLLMVVVPTFPGSTSSSASPCWAWPRCCCIAPIARRIPSTFEQPNLNQRGLQYIGSELVLVEAIEQGSGKAKLGDGVWKVSGPELPAGARVRVTGVNGTILTVIPV